YLRYFDGYGAVFVQMNVEDTRNGVAEYVAKKYGDKCIIELKWGQGAKDIGGEIQVTSLDYALFLKKRGYVVDPNPELPEVQEAFERKAIKSFARHSRLGGTNLNRVDQVREDFMKSVEYLRSLGFKRISLKTGSYGMEELAMAIKFATDAKMDLLTIDGSGGGTGMSPWNMMQSWGVPSILLHSKAYEYASILAAKGQRPVDLSFAGGFALEDSIFKALALGAPYTKMVCMGRAVMIPGYLGANIEGALHPERREKICGNWDKLPKTVTEVGSIPEEIFASYFDIQKKIGKDEMKKIPYGAMALWTLADKLACGLQQLMAGARKFSLNQISRNDLFAANRETAQETGIDHCSDVNDEQAKKILNS
ncbi:MAG: glutamate synthase-related protein, partial [Desulfobacteraceae bacterium]|nr:glutamate synthase-related protein [Desulfobacteraceae bacterium]